MAVSWFTEKLKAAAADDTSEWHRDRCGWGSHSRVKTRSGMMTVTSNRTMKSSIADQEKLSFCFPSPFVPQLSDRVFTPPGSQRRSQSRSRQADLFHFHGPPRYRSRQEVPRRRLQLQGELSFLFIQLLNISLILDTTLCLYPTNSLTSPMSRSCLAFGPTGSNVRMKTAVRKASRLPPSLNWSSQSSPHPLVHPVRPPTRVVP